MGLNINSRKWIYPVLLLNELMLDGAESEELIVDDNNSHDDKGPKYAVLRRTDTTWSVLEVDEGFQSEDKLLQGMIDDFKPGVTAFIPG